MQKTTSYPGDRRWRGQLLTKKAKYIILLASLAFAARAFLSLKSVNVDNGYIQSKTTGLQTKRAQNYTYNVPFPYHISKWAYGTSFYHKMQCVWTGITAANLDPDFAARHPEQIAFVEAKDGPFPRWSHWIRIFQQDPSSLVRKIEKAFWNVTDVISYQELISNDSHTGLSPLQPDFLRIAFDSDRACRGYNTLDVMDWFSCFLNAKFKSGRTRFDDDGLKNLTLRNCNATNIRSKLKALLVNRPGSRRISEDTVSELLSQSNMKSWTYRSNLASYGLLEQLRVFESHNLIVLPHGAAESNVVASSRWHSHVANRSHVPTTVVELCPPYAHCSCMQVCPDFYKNRMMGTAYFGIAFEKKGLNCKRFCAGVGSKTKKLKRLWIKRKPIPKVKKQIVSALNAFIDAEIIPRLASYCLGDDFDLKNTSVTIIEI